MRVFAAHGSTGSAFYRVLLPLGELGAHPGWDVRLKSGRKEIAEEDFAGADLIVGQRVSNFGAWNYAGRQSRLVYEIDDDPFSILPENRRAYEEWRSRPELGEETARCLARSDLVTVTTGYLAETMRQYNPDVLVLPNHLPACAFAPRDPGPLTVGWAGGDSHGRNVGVAAGAVRRFLRRSPAWRLLLAGSDFRRQFGGGEFTPWVDITARPEGYYRSLDFDIGLAPLLDNHFNRCKSPLRVLEYAARGIPVVASDVEPYRGFVDDGVTGFLVRREHEWLARISELAADEGLRKAMGGAARERARGLTIDAGWRRWAAAYS